MASANCFKICNGTWFKTVEVTVKGPGPGRESYPCITIGGLEVTAIRDVTQYLITVVVHQNVVASNL